MSEEKIKELEDAEPSDLKNKLYDYIYNEMGIESEQCHIIVKDLLEILQKELNKQIAEFLIDLELIQKVDFERMKQWDVLQDYIEKWEKRQKDEQRRE